MGQRGAVAAAAVGVGQRVDTIAHIGQQQRLEIGAGGAHRIAVTHRHIGVDEGDVVGAHIADTEVVDAASIDGGKGDVWRHIAGQRCEVEPGIGARKNLRVVSRKGRMAPGFDQLEVDRIAAAAAQTKVARQGERRGVGRDGLRKNDVGRPVGAQAALVVHIDAKAIGSDASRQHPGDGGRQPGTRHRHRGRERHFVHAHQRRAGHGGYRPAPGKADLPRGQAVGVVAGAVGAEVGVDCQR